MTRQLYLAWQSSESRRWYTIGVLTHGRETGYSFRFVRGVEQAQSDDKFSGISAFPEFKRVYRSEHLFSFFANRILSSDRPSYDDLLEQVDLHPAEDQQSTDYVFDFLRRTRGWRATDSFEMFSPVHQINDQRFEWDFFTRGLRHTDEAIQQRWTEADPELPLRMLPDPHNQYDPTAIIILDRKQRTLGFVPGNYSATIYELVSQARPGSIELKILRHNKPVALHQKRFLIKMRVEMPEHFELTHPPELEPLVTVD